MFRRINTVYFIDIFSDNTLTVSVQRALA